MKKINWKVRFKNPVFWTTFVSAGATFVYTILALFGITPAVSEDSVVNGAVAIIGGLATLGVLVDPTTSGIKDSSQALTYDKPKSTEE